MRSQSVDKAVEAAVQKFGGIDILINNASAINLAGSGAFVLYRGDLKGNALSLSANFPFCFEFASTQTCEPNCALFSIISHNFANFAEFSVHNGPFKACSIQWREVFQLQANWLCGVPSLL